MPGSMISVPPDCRGFLVIPASRRERSTSVPASARSHSGGGRLSQRWGPRRAMKPAFVEPPPPGLTIRRSLGGISFQVDRHDQRVIPAHIWSASVFTIRSIPGFTAPRAGPLSRNMTPAPCLRGGSKSGFTMPGSPGWHEAATVEFRGPGCQRWTVCLKSREPRSRR